MSVNVKLTQLEKVLARTLEVNNLIAIGISKDNAEHQCTGYHTGAMLAVARALNLYFNRLGGMDLVSHKKRTIRVLFTKERYNYYRLKEPLADMYVLVMSQDAETYYIMGYALPKAIKENEKDGKYIYHHVFELFKEEHVYKELILGNS